MEDQKLTQKLLCYESNKVFESDKTCYRGLAGIKQRVTRKIICSADNFGKVEKRLKKSRNGVLGRLREAVTTKRPAVWAADRSGVRHSYNMNTLART